MLHEEDSANFQLECTVAALRTIQGMYVTSISTISHLMHQAQLAQRLAVRHIAWAAVGCRPYESIQR